MAIKFTFQATSRLNWHLIFLNLKATLSTNKRPANWLACTSPLGYNMAIIMGSPFPFIDPGKKDIANFPLVVGP